MNQVSWTLMSLAKHGACECPVSVFLVKMFTGFISLLCGNTKKVFFLTLISIRDFNGS